VGEGAFTWTYLNDMLPWPGRNGAEDFFDHTVVAQKILAKPFSGSVAQGIILIIVNSRS
jgi:hypothetical protein